MEYSKDQIPFLDILIKRNKNGIWIAFNINPQTLKGVYLLHSVTQTIVNKISHFVYHKEFALLQKNNAEKLKNQNQNYQIYHYPDSLIKQGFQKALLIPQKDLRKPKKPSNENN